jgi:hypothetical protein
MGKDNPVQAFAVWETLKQFVPGRLVKLSKLLENYLSACTLRRAVSENQQLLNLILLARKQLILKGV